jgi:hypothetical protein
LSTPQVPGRPTSRRPFAFGRAAHALLALAAAPLFIAFTWQSTIATISDDSVSYLAMARWFAGSADAFLAPWLAWHSHFPPFFPMVLAATGGSGDFLVAHVVVAVFAAISVFLLARYAAIRLESDWGGFWVAAAFLLLPTAWVSVKGILSESLYLALSLAALIAHEKWLSRETARARDYLLFGVLLALAYSTRVVGVTLIAAWLAHEGVKALSTRRMPRAAWLALVPTVACAAAWALGRPGGHVYAGTIRSVARAWLADPLLSARVTSEMLSGGWVASFVAEGEVSAPVRMVILAVGAVALAGSVRAAMRNRIDGWYVLLSALLLFLWVFGVDNMRRLLYPVVPIALLHAAELVVAVARRLRVAKPRLAVAGVCAVPLALCLPATALVAEKALDDVLLVDDTRYRACDITDYYRVINRAEARALASSHAATLAGLEALRTATPEGARVMWMRPEYVALLGGREAVPYYYEWDARTLASKIREGGVDYLVIAGISKSDLAVRLGETVRALHDAQPYSRPVYALANPFTRYDEFILLQIDRGALDDYLAAAPR